MATPVIAILINPAYLFNKAAGLAEALAFRFRELLGARGGARCPVCGWRGFAFRSFTSPGVTYRRARAVCPSCGSLERDRALIILLGDLGLPERTLSISQVPGLQGFLRGRGARLTTADRDPSKADVAADVIKLPFADGAWPAVICIHVLEHVPDDRAAAREIYRVLAPGGYAVVQVPRRQDVATTLEYPGPAVLEEGHVRAYGADYAECLTGGLKADTLSVANDLSPEKTRLYGLRDAEFLVIKK